MPDQGTVYLVDDDPAILKALARLLRLEGYQTKTFSSGREFMNTYKPDGNGCLVLDLSMPEITGVEVQQWLADSSDPLPILFLTAQDNIPEQVRTSMKRVAGILKKPVSCSELVKAIEDALRK